MSGEKNIFSLDYARCLLEQVNYWRCFNHLTCPQSFSPPMPNNEYWLLMDPEWIEVPLSGQTSFAWGLDYLIDIMRVIEDRGEILGLTFYISLRVPQSLPKCDDKTVLVVIGDETYCCFPYFKNLLAILRCYGDNPRYLDGFPTSALQLSAFLQFVFKVGIYLRCCIQSGRYRSGFNREIRRRTLHIPLGCYGRLLGRSLEITERATDLAFLGSIEKAPDTRPLLRAILKRLVKPPKTISRQEMMLALEKTLEDRKEWTSTIAITSSFSDSESKQDRYSAAMANCKVSICPRGSNYETYRLNESFKMGCIVVCEPIPDIWFYQGHPAIIVNDWQHLPAILGQILEDPERCRRASKAAREFWESHLDEVVVASKIQSFLTGLCEEQDSNNRDPANAAISL
jgi:hypothetical protein